MLRNRSLVALRERVERQRSVQTASQAANVEQTNGSFEGLNLEVAKEKEKGRMSVERLDNQVTTLHNDVAALSMESSLEVVDRPGLQGPDV
uniref:Uncharacterized protein n=1 Tax=Anopheles stephensi TaxID=30069 RepID=A0A182YBZ5_ANOST